ncbi:MAG: putative DNA-binding domain-containing protein [Flavobacteriaceae bacterium]|nr:putative DNA-binding domain-containing protein [Flavobacteriaceae bacterium]
MIKTTDHITNLNQVQSWMQQAILAPGIQTDIADHINETSKLSAKRHLHIYQRSYIARLRECMKAQFQALNYALGDQLFQGFADLYLTEKPSRSYTLNNLGERFADFLEETRPDKEQKESWPDFMIQLADFEYLINLAFDEKVKDSFNQESEEIKLVKVFHLMKHDFPISMFYKDFINKRNPEIPLESESYCVVIRKHYKLGVFELQKSQYLFLKFLKDTQSVSKSIKAFSEQYNFSEVETCKFWEQWKKKWLVEGFFE